MPRECPPSRASWSKRGARAVILITGRHARRVVHGALQTATGDVVFLLKGAISSPRRHVHGDRRGELFPRRSDPHQLPVARRVVITHQANGVRKHVISRAQSAALTPCSD